MIFHESDLILDHVMMKTRNFRRVYVIGDYWEIIES